MRRENSPAKAAPLPTSQPRRPGGSHHPVQSPGIRLNSRGPLN